LVDYEKLSVLLAAIVRRRRWGFVRRRLALGGGRNAAVALVNEQPPLANDQ